MRFSRPIDTSYVRWHPLKKQAKTDLEKELLTDIELLQKQIDELFDILEKEERRLGTTCMACANSIEHFTEHPVWECKVTGDIHEGDWKCNVKISREGKIEEV